MKLTYEDTDTLLDLIEGAESAITSNDYRVNEAYRLMLNTFLQTHEIEDIALKMAARDALKLVTAVHNRMS